MKNFKHLSLSSNRQTIAKALAEKGGPGLLALTFVLLVVWGATLWLASYLLRNLPSSGEAAANPTWWVTALVAIGLLCGAFWFTSRFLGMLVPTLRIDAETRNALASAFGGRLSTVDGGIGLLQLSKEQAEQRIKKIMFALTKRASNELAIDHSQVGSNIFAFRHPVWLSIRNGFHINMMSKARGPEETTIRILNGFYSTGTSYRYGKPVLSIVEEGKAWSHSPNADDMKALGYDAELLEQSGQEIAKAPAELAWIISMPIPFQVSPFQMSCGVLNLDSLGRKPQRDELRKLLADVATAAALVGVINRTTDVLQSSCHRPEPEQHGLNRDRLPKDYLISTDEFNPVDCPEPTEEFKSLLAGISGLEFLKQVTPSDVALFLREQLRN